MSEAPEQQDEAQSVGDDPRKSPQGLAKYRDLRDARSAARAEERRQDGEDPSIRSLKAPMDWSRVQEIAHLILADIGQDIEVAVWLIEAETRISGHSGLARTMARLTEMVSRYGRMLHPQPEDNLDEPFDMIAALNGVGREGALIQPLRLTPLVPGLSYGEASLWHAMATDSQDEMRTMLTEPGMDAVAKKLAEIDDARSAVYACDRALTDLLGADAPPFGQIVDVLDESERMIQNLAPGVQMSMAAAEEAAEDPDTPPDAAPTPKVKTGEIASREEAFEQLLKIAAFFRRTEPHSPMGDALETIVRRGRMDFMALIEELIPDPNIRRAMMTTAGIGNKPDNEGSNH
ncbi:ImpA family type VI secretion system protein [Thalassococcus sp. S3]|uniref:type VI secretion system protein TssA n=1 Tax=Thalassococcus sp. S3 TaxID=2017482 RepID=UPI001024554A|nr:type VI secretion system ImpA family N-terminal domain-containing protein [Thalassococcus sp. S3]QBF32470.1 hypothetical protein CFI11_14780 [Thalassococcus sp. S3]